MPSPIQIHAGLNQCAKMNPNGMKTMKTRDVPSTMRDGMPQTAQEGTPLTSQWSHPRGMTTRRAWTPLATSRVNLTASMLHPGGHNEGRHPLLLGPPSGGLHAPPGLNGPSRKCAKVPSARGRKGTQHMSHKKCDGCHYHSITRLRRVRHDVVKHQSENMARSHGCCRCGTMD